MSPRGTRGAYRKEGRARLPQRLQMELVEKAAMNHGNCQELAKALEIPKSSVHYYRTGKLTVPASLLERMLKDAGDPDLERRVREATETLDRTWANYYSSGINREMCRERVRLPTRAELEKDDDLRRKAAAIVSYVMAEGSIWTQEKRWGETVVNITFADHETDLYEHFRGLCRDVFDYDIGPSQAPGNGAKAIRGFIYSRFVAEWLVENGVPIGDKSAARVRLPEWVMRSDDRLTWIGAVQPFCDGEGSFNTNGGVGRPTFTVTQSRHTELDFAVLPHSFGYRGASRTLNRGILARMSVFDVPVLEYCSAMNRSEVLDDVRTLIKRLGFETRSCLGAMYLKDDGFWSCDWIVRFPSHDSARLVRTGLVTQRRKAARGIQNSMQ